MGVPQSTDLWGPILQLCPKACRHLLRIEEPEVALCQRCGWNGVPRRCTRGEPAAVGSGVHPGYGMSDPPASSENQPCHRNVGGRHFLCPFLISCPSACEHTHRDAPSSLCCLLLGDREVHWLPGHWHWTVLLALGSGQVSQAMTGRPPRRGRTDVHGGTGLGSPCPFPPETSND